jgi:hypothetical protein
MKNLKNGVFTVYKQDMETFYPQVIEKLFELRQRSMAMEPLNFNPDNPQELILSIPGKQAADLIRIILGEHYAKLLDSTLRRIESEIQQISTNHHKSAGMNS